MNFSNFSRKVKAKNLAKPIEIAITIDEHTNAKNEIRKSPFEIDCTIAITPPKNAIRNTTKLLELALILIIIFVLPRPSLIIVPFK